VTRRDLSLFPDAQHSFSSIDTFMEAPVPTGIITIDYNGSPLDILNRPSGANTTLVVFHTMLSVNMRTLPVFSGLGVTRGLPLNVVCVSDPSLLRDDNLRLAWFAGNDQQPLQRDLPGVLRHIFDSHGDPHIAFLGASGGGFAALYYSQQFAGSLAVSLNPQTKIRDFSPEASMDYARACFGARSLDEANDVLAHRVTGDLKHVYRGGFHNTVAYVQNYMDSRHLWRQMTPFLEAVPRSNRMQLLVEDWGLGHVPPPADVTVGILRGAASCDGEWLTGLRGLGFVGAPDPFHGIRIRELNN
jgi:hypothetical protein